MRSLVLASVYALVIAVLVAATGCTSAPSAAREACATPDDAVANADVTLTAGETWLEPRSGQGMLAWTFDGDVPGPALRLNVGDTRRIKLVNDSPRDVSLHFHGLAYPPDDDGTDTTPKSVVHPGCAHVYSVTATRPGVFPYHSHLDTRVEVARGLYGAVIVPDPAEVRADRELVLFMGQLGLEGQGAHSEEAEEEAESEGEDESGFAMTFNGRASGGQHVVIALEGDRYVATPGEESARVGQLVRWRIVNVSPDDLHTFGIHAHGFCDRGGGPAVSAGGNCPDGGQMTNIVDLSPLKGTTIEYVEQTPGRWMYHCHILDHAVDGMSGYYDVTP